MEAIDKIKVAWNSDINNTFKKQTSYDIKKIISQNSKSSINKIYIISIIEFSIWFVLNIWNTFFSTDQLTKSVIYDSLFVFEIINYCILIFFIYKFYIYKEKISATENIKILMQNILDIRANMRKYLIYNIIVFNFYGVILMLNELIFNDKFNEMSLQNSFIKLFLAIVIFSIISIIIYLIYKLIYVYFTKKLLKNYKLLDELN